MDSTKLSNELSTNHQMDSTKLSNELSINYQMDYHFSINPTKSFEIKSDSLF